jgi:hypothetical protein
MVRLRFNDQHDQPAMLSKGCKAQVLHMQLQLLFYKTLNYHFVKILIPPHLDTKLISLSTTGALLFMQLKILSRNLTF